MDPFDFPKTADILSRTPGILQAWLGDLPPEWANHRPSEGEWSAFDILGHFIHGEKTDWIPRARLILERGEIPTFQPFDRFAQYRHSQGKSHLDLLAEFAILRQENLTYLRSLDLVSQDYNLQGRHPDLGIVTLQQLLATWVVHDLDHLAQLAQALASRYTTAVGPWRAYLGILEQ